MKALRLIFNRRVMAILGLIAVGLIVWFLGPLLAFANWHPLDSEIVRAVVIAVIVLFYVGRWAWRMVVAKQKNAQLTEGLVAQSAEAPKGAAAGAAGTEEVALLRQRFEEAVSLLKESKKKKSGKLASMFGGQFLYELPWYMFIGAPGSGKTTALVNSGLQFPLAERFGHEAIAGVGGTRNCDWWFTDEAVLLDTAGRYTTQESDRDADSAAWAGFLKLLSKYRPRRPINGALVTVSVADLLQQSAADMETHARALRARIQELHEQLNVRFPLYVLVSKTDLLPGFMEFFGEFSREEREQVWGTTFELAGKDGNVLAGFNERFDALEKRINDRLIDRLQVERDPQKRALLYTFPQHFSALKEPHAPFQRRHLRRIGHRRHQPEVGAPPRPHAVGELRAGRRAVDRRDRRVGDQLQPQQGLHSRSRREGAGGERAARGHTRRTERRPDRAAARAQVGSPDRRNRCDQPGQCPDVDAIRLIPGRKARRRR
jgi:type VI secretion system protein ImpL